jgi:hypothetical protein
VIFERVKPRREKSKESQRKVKPLLHNYSLPLSKEEGYGGGVKLREEEVVNNIK